MSIISNEIKAYNMQLANTLTKIDLQDYITEFHTKFCSEYDISFMEYFMKLVEHEHEFIVDHEKLIEFGVITTSNKSNNIKRLLDQFNFKEGKDFNLLNVEQVRKKQNGASCGTVIKKIYTLTPETFKICLMRSQNTLDYNMYYIFIEKVMKYYSDYQADYYKHLSSMKDDKIDRLQNKVDGLIILNENQTKDLNTLVLSNQRLEIYAKDTNAKISELHVLLYKMFALLLTDIYCHDVKVMKTLILFVYKKDGKYYLSFTYCQLSLLHVQIKKKFSDVDVVNIIIFKPLKDNVITIQKVLDKLSLMYTVNKRTNTIICNKEQKKEVIKKIRVIVNESSINSISNSIKKSENLRHEQDIFTKCTEADNKFKLIFQHHTKPYINTIMNDEYCKDEQVEYLNDIKNLINDFRKGDLDKYF